ncbi:MAG: hypothetical protein HQL22_10580 [Candidatus Omnitrophica bacterium]|nr:hypothetical protein [Candidatus Omnitrophota bacterium]
MWQYMRIMLLAAGIFLVCVLAQADVQPPVITQTYPLIELSARTTYSHVDLQTSGEAVCRYSLTPGVAYADMTQALDAEADRKTFHIYQKGLKSGQRVTYYVRCQGQAANFNTYDTPVTLKIATSVPDPGIHLLMGRAG